MGRVAIASENRTGEGSAGFPAIKLTEKGQKTRFTVIETPWREYVHYIKCPQFDDEGKVKKTKKTKKSGEDYDALDLEFVGQPICLGDEGTLREKGTDEKNCPACEASVASGGDIPGPIQRFAVNVIEYVTTPQLAVKKPFSASVKVWKFTGRIYDEIEGIQQEIGDLRKHDLTLECEDPYWGRNKLAFKMEPGYSGAPQGYIKELLGTPGNKATDAQLKDACGREVPRGRMQEDVDYALRQWRKHRNEGSDVPAEFRSNAADLAGGVDDLFAEETQGSAPAVSDHAAAAEADPFAEFAPEPTPETPSASSTAAPPSSSASASATTGAAASDAPPSEDDPFGGEAPAAETAAAAPAESSGDFDFDNLLGSI